jgi:hypothetical protein
MVERCRKELLVIAAKVFLIIAGIDVTCGG